MRNGTSWKNIMGLMHMCWMEENPKHFNVKIISRELEF
jgi:hypothetical protein